MCQQLPIGSLTLAILAWSRPNGAQEPEREMCPGHSGPEPSLWLCRTTVFAFRVPLASLLDSGPSCSYAFEPLYHLLSPSHFTFLAHFPTCSFHFVPWTSYLILFLSSKVWLYSLVTLYISDYAAFGLNWTNILFGPAFLPRLPLTSVSWAGT